MKLFLLLAILLPFAAGAQNCKIVTEKDPFSQQTRYTTGFMEFSAGGEKLLLSIVASGKEIDYFFALNNSSGGKCFDNSSNLMFLFEGGKQKVNYKNTGTMNCEGLFHVTFKNAVTTPSSLKRLLTKKIIALHFTGTDKKVIEVPLSEQEQQMLTDMSVCLVEEAKKLLQ